jgi:hypothetical protein
MLGFFIAKAFNNPFILYNSAGKLNINCSYDRGYLFIAPLITAFMVWFINKIKEDNFDIIYCYSSDNQCFGAI